ncbi:MAG: hypothetical protein CBC40_01640 [bacterium TMED80]|nr:MAG: hypothetical protein CBC40_01640 [bacterium TMED80]
MIWEVLQKVVFKWPNTLIQKLTKFKKLMSRGISMLMLIGLQSCNTSKKDISYLSESIEPPSTFIATKSDYQTNPVEPNSIIMGYLIDGYKPTDEQFKNLSHIGISFLRADNIKGDVVMADGWDNIDDVISSAHKNDVKAIISFGGGSYIVTSELMGVKKNRQNLIKNIVRFMVTHKLDGFDCDWEPSWLNDKKEMESVNNAINHHYIKFIKELRIAIDAEFGKGEKSFSAAVMNANNIWYSSKKQISHFPQNGWWHFLDWVALMNYDNDLGAKHSTFESVYGPNGSVKYWNSFGVPLEKIVTGIPFYARAGWGEEWLFYKDIVKMNTYLSFETDFIMHKKNSLNEKEYGFNGKSTIVKKVQENKKLNLPGIMFWQLAGDVEINSEYSLLRVINKNLN